jgi:hypothetical protein
MAMLGCSPGLPVSPSPDASLGPEINTPAPRAGEHTALPDVDAKVPRRSSEMGLVVESVDAQDLGDSLGCEDSAEPNDRRADAWAVSLAERLEARMCADDVDWIEVELVVGQRVAVEIETDGAERLSSPLVFQPRGRKPLGRAVTSPNTVGRIWTASVKGKYRIRIDPPRDGGRVDYTVTVTEASPKDGGP